jgi:hypothetical protein
VENFIRKCPLIKKDILRTFSLAQACHLYRKLLFLSRANKQDQFTLALEFERLLYSKQKQNSCGTFNARKKLELGL